MNTALTIAGSDCSGGAGIQADIKTMSALGVYAMSVIVAVVAENTRGVISVEKVSAESIGEQIDAALDDIGADAVKIGMLTDRSIAVVADKLKGYSRHVVVDPVMYAKDGTPLLDEDSIDEYIAEILPLATVFTPNIPEAERIIGEKIVTVEDMKEAARKICGYGAKSVLLKGGHYAGDATDVFFDGEFHIFTAERIATKNTHGTGCTLSSAIASYLAKGYSPCEAVKCAKDYVTSAIEHALPLGKGHGPLDHFFAFGMGEKIKFDLSLYLCTDRSTASLPFARCVEEAILGGVTVVQLREKQSSGADFADMGCEIRRITAKYNVPLIVNDRVDIALAIRADGVHVGQSDLDCASVRRLVGDRMIVGVTAHSVAEAAKAERDGADYIGVGAMAATGTKSDAKLLPPGELERIRKAVKLPIVIIGGINKANVLNFKGKGADGIAVSSAIMRAADPRAEAKELYRLWKE